MTTFNVGIKLRTYNHNLHKALLAAQEKHGLGRVEYCKQKLGIPYQTIAGLLTFKAYPSEERLLKISIALEVTPDSIFPEELKPIRMTKQPDPVLIPLAEAIALGFGGDEELNSLEGGEHGDTLNKIVIQRVLEKLPERDAQVLRMRYGIDGGDAMSLREIGREFGVTGNRIMQIHDRALRRLRHPSRSREVRDFQECDAGLHQMRSYYNEGRMASNCTLCGAEPPPETVGYGGYVSRTLNPGPFIPDTKDREYQAYVDRMATGKPVKNGEWSHITMTREQWDSRQVA